MSKTIGIIGGMGPAATIDLFQKIVSNTPARTDQEHLQIFIYNNPKIPPREQLSNDLSKTPLPELIKSAITLEQAGADFIIMACNTAHIWINELKKSVKIPFYSMIENTVQAIIEDGRTQDRNILLLATETTINSRLYQAAFLNSNFNIVIPNIDEQIVIDKAIKDVKAGQIAENQYYDKLNEIINLYENKRITALIGGCTEIPLMFSYLKIEMKLIDPTLLLAKMAIAKALNDEE